MLIGITRNNRLFMLGNFLFALSYGLWMNLRQLHLLDLGATPVQIGGVFALVSLAGGLLPLPAGLLADRIGPKRVIVLAWLVAAAGALTAALAPTWPLAGAGYVIFMLCIAANPAVVSYVLLNTPDQAQEGAAERVMATVFASWPAAMIFAPALGGFIADRLGLQADLWLGAAGLLVAAGIFSLAGNTQSAHAFQRPSSPAATAGASDQGALNLGTEPVSPLLLVHNRQYLALAAFFALALMALYLGYTLAPTYLEDTRGYAPGFIGLLFSVSSVGTLLLRSVVIHFRPRVSFALLVAASGLGTLGLWQAPGELWLASAFVLLGAISTLWVVMQASIGRSVPEHLRGLALGVTETLYYGGMALSSGLAGWLYARSPAHDLPLIYGLAAIAVILVLWLALPLGRPQAVNLRAEAAPAGLGALAEPEPIAGRRGSTPGGA